MARQTMSDLIKSEDAIEALYKAWDGGWIEVDGEWVADNCRAILATVPTIDAVEVVRCKDCKYKSYGVDYMWCDLAQGLADSINDDDFCSYGESEGE